MRKLICSFAVAAFALAIAGCAEEKKNSIPTVDPNAKPPKLTAAGSDGGAKKNTPGPQASEK